MTTSSALLDPWATCNAGRDSCLELLGRPEHRDLEPHLAIARSTTLE